MSKAKWIFLIPIFLIFPPSIFMYIWWKFFKKLVEIDLKIIYMTLRIPVFLLIELPLKLIGKEVKAIENFFEKGYNGFKKKVEVEEEGKGGRNSFHLESKLKKSYIFFMLFLASIIFVIFAPATTPEGAISFVTDFTGLFVLMLLAPPLIMLTISGILNRNKSQDPPGREQNRQREQPQQGQGRNLGDRASSAAGEAVTAYSHLETAQDMASGDAQILSPDMVKKLSGMPLIGSIISSASSAGTAAAGAASGVSLSAALPIVAALLLALLIGIIIFVIQAVIVTILFWGIFLNYLPLVFGPLASIMGWGADWGYAADQTIIPSIMPDIGLEEELMAVREAGAKASCFAQGPACMAEWRQNNTVQPGSEAVGQEYRLEVSDFIVEGGGTLDVANRRANYPLTSRLVIENSRYGLRGITAENVTYEIGLEADGGITSEDGTLCSTGAVDLWSEDRDDFRDNNLPPGDAYQLTSFQRGQSFYQDNITLENCGLLQPGQIELSRSAFLDIVYDYSSRSTLEIDAMSEQNLQEMGIRRDFEESETADTPVKSFVNVYSPVIFERLDNRRVSTPFDVEVGFDTDDPEVKYNITSDSLRFRASRLTAPSALIDDPDVENTQAAIGQVDEINDRSCDLEPVEGEPHVYKPSEQALDDIQLMQDEGMFTYRRSPPTLSCSFQLINPDAISPSGETLIMDVEGDYTVEDREESEAFQVWNTGCRGNDCPLLVPEDLVEYSNADSDNFISTCSRSARADASGGCDVRYLPLSNTDEFDGDEWRTLRYDRGHNLGALLDESDSDFLSEMDIGEVSIESNLINTDSISTGDTAFTYAGLIKHLEDNIRDSDNMEVINIDTIGDHDSLPDEENQTSPYTAFGIDTSDRSTYEEIISEDSGFALEIRNNQLSISQTDDYCDEKEGEELLEAWEESNFGNPVFLAIETDRGECEDEHEFNRRTGGTNVGSP